METSILAATLYSLNMVVGVAAWRSRRNFGKLHHILFAVVLTTAALAAWLEFHPGWLLTLGALVILPAVSAHSRWHAALASLGALGWALALARA